MSFKVFSTNLSSQIQISVEKYQLKNGLTVLLNTDDKLSVVSYILGYRVGSRHEREGITGISHMFEHLMFRGTDKYPDFNNSYAKNGVISVNAFTSRDYTAYHAVFAPDKLEFILDVEADRMSNLILNQTRLDKERGAVQEERRMRTDNSPFGFLFENLMLLSFSQHPYRFPIIGFEQDISDYQLKDLKDWYETYYSPNNAVLVLSGNFSKNAAKLLIEKYFAGLKAKEIPKEKKWIEPEQTQARQKVLTKDIQSTMVMLSYTGPPSGTKESYALAFLSHIMGAGESSVLYKKMVRQTQLLPSISVSNYELLKSNLFNISYHLPHLDKEQAVKRAVLDAMHQALNSPLTKESIEKARNILIAEMVDALKRSKSRARLLLDYEISFNDYKKMYEQIAWLDELDLNFIQSTGQKYLKEERLNYVILKPGKYKSI